MEKTLIIYRMGSLGDTVVALPCLHKVVECFPDYRRVALTNFPISSEAAPLQDILGATGLIHDAISYPYGMRDPKQLFALLKNIRAVNAKTLIYIGGGRSSGVTATYRDVVFLHLAGIRTIIGAPITRNLDYGNVDTATGFVEQESSRLARCLSKLGKIDVKSPASWDLHLTSAETAAADAMLSPITSDQFIVVNTGGKWAQKDWGDKNWASLLVEIANIVNCPLVFVGASEDNIRAEALAGIWPTTVINTCGLLTPRESAALIRQASLFIGHDSGPMHLAASQSVPCVALFGGYCPPGKWYPQGPGYINHYVHRNNTDITLINPKDVKESIFLAWRNRSRGY